MSKKILLFIPGYYGSNLKEVTTGKKRWAQVSNFLFSQTGVMDIIPGTEIGSHTKLEVDGIVTSVNVIPKIWEIDAYAKTLEQLDEFAVKNDMRLETVAYDWRDDFNASINVIDEKIKGLNLTDKDELHIVSHSMGALFMAYYLRYGTQDVDHAQENWAGIKKIKKLVMVAPPLHGLMILFRDIEEGTSIWLNRSLLSALDYVTFKSSYLFLPVRGEDIVLNEKKEKISVDIHNIDKWQQNAWGPFKFAKPSEVKTVRAFVEKYMNRSEKFHALLRAPIKVAPPKKLPLLHMRGLGHPTLEYASIKDDGKRINYSFKKKDAVDGDGTVTNLSGRPLDYFSALDFTFIENGLGHLDLLAKPESQIFIQDFLKK